MRDIDPYISVNLLQCVIFFLELPEFVWHHVASNFLSVTGNKRNRAATVEQITDDRAAILTRWAVGHKNFCRGPGRILEYASKKKVFQFE